MERRGLCDAGVTFLPDYSILRTISEILGNSRRNFKGPRSLPPPQLRLLSVPRGVGSFDSESNTLFRSI